MSGNKAFKPVASAVIPGFDWYFDKRHFAFASQIERLAPPTPVTLRCCILKYIPPFLTIIYNYAIIRISE
jgi:hypothetical protein